MPASVREIDFSEPQPGKVWEPGEHEGCAEQEIYHFHVTKPSGLKRTDYGTPKS